MEKYSFGQLEEDLIKVNHLLSEGRYNCCQDYYDGFSIFATAMGDLEKNINDLTLDEYYLLHNTILMYGAIRKKFTHTSDFIPLQASINKSFIEIVNHPRVKEVRFERKYN